MGGNNACGNLPGMARRSSPARQSPSPSTGQRAPDGARRPPARGAAPSATLAPEYRFMLAQLRAVRTALGLSQTEVGRRLGRANQFVSKCETGERRLDPIDLWHFARVYGEPVSAFLPPIASTE